MPLDINCFRDGKSEITPDDVRASCRRRYQDPVVVDTVQALDAEWRASIHAGDNLRKQKTLMSKEIGALLKAKKDAKEQTAKVKEVTAAIAANEEETKALEKKVHSVLTTIGNIVEGCVPTSNDEEDNVVVRTWGECKRQEKMYHHHELLHMIDGYESERGVAVAGHRAYFLKGVGVLLNQALINFGLNFLCNKEYTPLQPPFFMKKNIMAETAQLEEFDEALYKVTGDGEDKYLIATSEQPISAFHRHDWMNDSELPKRYAGFSTCFRKEAGSHGKDTWGIFRIHQFEKVEQFCITKPEDSVQMHDEMIATAEAFYKALNIPYRVVNICSGELNNAAAKKFDLEAWFPTLGNFRELVSSSNCTDYQSRAMETRYGVKKAGGGEKTYVHMLNATLCATERAICCILENYQTPEGVMVPECLQPYMGGRKFMPFVRDCPVNTTAIKQQAALDKAARPAKAKAAPKSAPAPKKAAAGKPAAVTKPAVVAAAAAPAPAAGAGGDLAAQIAEWGSKVRDLKKAKAGKEEVMAAVAKLLALKKEAGVLPEPNKKK